jgi:hypothetical protein
MSAARSRSTGKKIALGFALFCALCLIVSAGVFIWFVLDKGMQDVLTASAMATTLFFASCTFLLYQMSKPPLHELLPWDVPDAATDQATDQR